MASHKNGVSQLHYCFSEVLPTQTLLIEPTPIIRHKKVIGISIWSGEKVDYKIP